MGIKAEVRRRVAVGLAGALLASSLVAGIAPVAADGNGADGPDGHIDNLQADRDLTYDTPLAITSVTTDPVVSINGAMAPPTAAVLPPLNDGARFVEDLNDHT
jgi:hypothetical protein